MQHRRTLEESDSEHLLSSKDKTPLGRDNIRKVNRRTKRSSTLG
jgi:hypothetical protein